jgi:hypothetical protein
MLSMQRSFLQNNAFILLTLIAVYLLGSGGSLAASPKSPIRDFQGDEGVSLAKAPLSANVKKQILRALVDLNCTGDELQRIEERTHATTVSLGSYPHPIIRIWGGGGLCGATGNCMIALFDSVTGADILNSLGWKWITLPHAHNGLQDIIIQESDGCCRPQIRHSFRFDGTVYKQLDQP